MFEEIINNYGMFASFLIILLEYACFPISSEIVLTLSGYLAEKISFPFFGLYLLSILAGLI